MSETQLLVSYLIFLASMMGICVLYIRHETEKDEREFQKTLAKRRIASLEDKLERWKKYVPLKELD